MARHDFHAIFGYSEKVRQQSPEFLIRFSLLRYGRNLDLQDAFADANYARLRSTSSDFDVQHDGAVLLEMPDEFRKIRWRSGCQKISRFR